MPDKNREKSKNKKIIEEIRQMSWPMFLFWHRSTLIAQNNEQTHATSIRISETTLKQDYLFVNSDLKKIVDKLMIIASETIITSQHVTFLFVNSCFIRIMKDRKRRLLLMQLGR